MIHEVSVDVLSRDRPHGVVAFREGALACSCARGRNIVRAEGALRRTHEAVKHTVYVYEDSFDLPGWSEAYAECAVAAARGTVSARGIEPRDGGVGGAQKGGTQQG